MLKSLDQVLKHLSYLNCIGNVEQPIAMIELNSRSIKKNGVFVAIKGFSADGHQFIESAIDHGASVVVCENLPEVLSEKVTYVQVLNSRQTLGLFSKIFYENADEKLIKVGVTGTNGKTTTTFFIRQIANLLGLKCGLIGTIEYDNGNEISVSTHTTPEAHHLHRLFYEMVENGCKLVVMEISSHALSLNRVENLMFDHALFTNFTQDHLDFHESLDDYLHAKMALFQKHLNGFSHINQDDETICKQIFPNARGFSLLNQSELQIIKFRQTAKGSEFTLSYNSVDYEFITPVLGEFNLYNILASIDVFLAQGIEMKRLQAVVSKLNSVPGRIEVVRMKSRQVIVDYAHTPDALEKILETCKPLSAGKLYCVFGCGGDRDQTKRPLMAKAAEKFSDGVIVTSDNPRTENPNEIINDILQGIVSPLFVEPDRKQAIWKTLDLMTADDLLVIAGKGHETYQEINGERHHFSDREMALEWENK